MTLKNKEDRDADLFTYIKSLISKPINKCCNYRFDNKSNLGGVEPLKMLKKNQQAP